MLIVCPVWFWEGFTGTAVISGVVLIRRQWMGRSRWWHQGYSKKKTPIAPTICQTNHHISYKPQHKTKLMEMLWIHAILLKPTICPTPYVLASQCFAQSCVEKQTWSSLVILSLCFEYMQQQNAFHLLCRNDWFSQICMVTII